MKSKRRSLIDSACGAAAALLAFIPLQFLAYDFASLAFAFVVLMAIMILTGFAIASRSFAGVAIVVAYIFIAVPLVTNRDNAYSLREKVKWA